MINSYLSERAVPLAIKETLICLLLKKPLPNLSILGNFHPVSKPLFWGNIFEIVVVRQLRRTLFEADCLDHFQLGFWTGYGTETVFVTLLDDLWQGLDGNCTFILVLLDLSSVFNTINHNILLD